MELLEQFAALKEENQSLKEQLKSYEFENDVKSIYAYSWSRNDSVAEFDESGLLRYMAKTGDLNYKELHNLFLKYGYDYVNNYFKKKHEEYERNRIEQECKEEGESDD